MESGGFGESIDGYTSFSSLSERAVSRQGKTVKILKLILIFLGV